MTTNDSKKLIRMLIAEGLEKNKAFEIAVALIDTEYNEKRERLERFRYEINAEEQRRSDEQHRL